MHGRTQRPAGLVAPAALVVLALVVLAPGVPAATHRQPVAATARPATLRAVEAASVEALAEVRLRRARVVALRRLARTEAALPAGRFPTVAADGRWRTEGPWTGWLAGFHPGELWTAYELTGRPAWARLAVRRQRALAPRAADTATHDLGFLLQTGFGRGVRLRGRTADAAVLDRAAGSLASRWVPAAHALRSWDGPPGEVTVIVDSLMNLELLLAAADRADARADPAAATWRGTALAHAATVARVLVRPDGSTLHVARLDERTGEVSWAGTVQGLRDSSTWARGQSWAVHGFTTVWRESGDPAMLAAARATARWAVTHMPADGVPAWDSAAAAPRDASAAAVLASGLLELARLDPDPGLRAAWTRAGRRILHALTGPAYLATGHSTPALLRHVRHSPEHPDAGTSYADLYLLEAMQRDQLLPSQRPVLRVAGRRDPAPATRVLDLGRVRAVSGVSVRWAAATRRLAGPGDAVPAVRFRVDTSVDGRRWVRGRSAVSSGEWTGFETYDVRDRPARLVRLTLLGDLVSAAAVDSVRVRGQST